MTADRVQSSKKRHLWVELGLGAAIVVTLVPLVWMVLLAFLPNRDIVASGWQFGFWMGNFAAVFADGTFISQVRNSVAIVIGAVTICLVVGATSGYALAKLKPPRWITIPALVITGFVPLIPPMTLVPGLYLLLGELGLLGTVTGLVLVNAFLNLPFATLLMMSYFAAIPEELREAALVDGASEARALVSVMLPVVKPGLAATGIFVAILSWNEFMMGLTLTSGGETSPVTVGIAGLLQTYAVTWGELAAAGLVAALPIILIAIFANRQIVAGLTAGAVKG